MLFICSHITHKSWIYSLLFRGQRKLISSTVNWMMKRGNNSPSIFRSKRQRTMDQSTDNKFQSAHQSNHASPGPGNVTEVNGDLFSCPTTHSLAHCISADVKMGRGIAVTFKNRFQGISELLYQNQRPGGLAILNREQRFVYYLVTKEKYWEKPTYDTLRSSLVRMRDHNVKNGVENLCMPKIGCGLDKLQWHKVLAMIREIYKGLDINITIYHFDDGKKDTAKERGKQRTLDGNVGADRSRGQHGRAEPKTRDDGEETADKGVATQRRVDGREEDHQRSNGREYPPREGSSNQRQRHQKSGERCPRDVQGGWRGRRELDQAGPAAHARWSGKNREYGPELPPDKNKKRQQQPNIGDYFTKSQPDSRKGKEIFQEEFPAPGESGKNKQQDKKETRRNEEGVKQRDQQHQTSTNKSNSPPAKIKRPPHSGLINESADAKKADGTERKVDEDKKRKDEKSDGEPPICEKGSQVASKDSEQSSFCDYERQGEEEYQTTTNNSKEQRKGSHYKVRDEHDKVQTCPEEDKVSQDTDKNTDESQTLKDKREDSINTTRNESHLENKNSDAVSPASASESIVVNTRPRQERDGGRDVEASVTSTDEGTGKTTLENGKDCDKFEKKPSGSTVETSGGKKKKKKKNKKKKSKE